MKDLGIRYNNEFEIAQSFDMKIAFEKLNPTPLMADNYQSTVLDFNELDISYNITLNFSPLIMHVKQDVYTYLLRCNDLNLNYTDMLAKYF